MVEPLATPSTMGPDIVSSDLSLTGPDLQSPSTGRIVEIDTSAPFESVREAVSRFGGMGFWKPYQLNLSETPERDAEETFVSKPEEQTAALEKDLILKETETLEILKELESTKTAVEELRSKLMQKEAPEDCNRIASPSLFEKENYGGGRTGMVIMELNQAKMSLSRTTNNLAGVRASVELLNKKLEKERTSLEKTRESLNKNSSTITYLEKDIDETNTRLKFAKELEMKGGFSDDPLKISKELQRLSSEAEKFKKMGEKARWVVIRATGEIEQTQNRIKTAEISLVAARKMKEAARAAEAVALAEIKSLSNRKISSQNAETVTISVEEYSLLNQKAKNGEELAKTRVRQARLKVEEEEVTKAELLKKVDEAAMELKTSKKALEETLERVEAANGAKLEVEEEFRKWRSEKGHRRRSYAENTTKFKNSRPPQHKIEACLLNQNGIDLMNDGPLSGPALKKPTVSIGEILSRKLLLADEARLEILAEQGVARQTVSLGQLLGKTDRKESNSSHKNGGKENNKRVSGKRKKFGLAKFSAVLANKQQNAKKKKMDVDLRC